ncbi:hypothetical protein BDR26DRAFT_858447 [Obelidium mucronatum]|nr:hypothetical protein BDR26DRAFT_858447 [Obelidium mucronatum]
MGVKPYSVIAKTSPSVPLGSSDTGGASTTTVSPQRIMPGRLGSITSPATIRSEVISVDANQLSSHSTTRFFNSAENDELCPFAYNGLCRFADKCRYTHGLKCPRCQKFCLHPRNLELRDKHLEDCANSDIRNYGSPSASSSIGGGGGGGGFGIGPGGGGGGGTAAAAAHSLHSVVGVDNSSVIDASRISSEMDCVVCFERVLRKRDPRFGLLSCEHCVCLECIRQWRQNEGMDNSKACPICRQITHIIIPSSIWIVDPEGKEAALEAYKKRMHRIDCKHYNFGEGTCPFGTSCLYRHVRRDGTVDEGRVRFVVGGQEGEAKVMGSVQLFDFFTQ